MALKAEFGTAADVAKRVLTITEEVPGGKWSIEDNEGGEYEDASTRQEVIEFISPWLGL